jgi:hypothetical protein
LALGKNVSLPSADGEKQAQIGPFSCFFRIKTLGMEFAGNLQWG